MFKKLKEAIESALGALESRSGDTTREDVEKLLDGMREELIETKARIPPIASIALRTFAAASAPEATATREPPLHKT